MMIRDDKEDERIGQLAQKFREAIEIFKVTSVGVASPQVRADSVEAMEHVLQELYDARNEFLDRRSR